ncbi:lysine-rich arabinogalactan protein 19 [Oryza brachyantha]|nr:lysine-rich arabinogalactan protein 19 [Oryza brachyantha]XP_015688891.1 lysine-rich arabinogalactan protein 19 [Oryza brachyantha]XP_040376245.1 lysine-rich arabinogalactan protein 19 [Oryza brachyantha]
MGSTSSPSSPPPPMIGRAGNLTVFITPPSPASKPRSSRRSESLRSGLSTPAPALRTPASPSPSLSSDQKTASPPAIPMKFSPHAAPVKAPPHPVQVPPPQYEKASAEGKHDGSTFGFFWDALARVQEAHASLDEYVANWFGLDQSKYQWALNDYYESTGKEVESGKPGKPKDLIASKVQKV